MISHASSCISKYQVAEDCKTNHRRWKGKDFDRPICEFGECIIALKLDSVGKQKSKVRWIQAVFLGIREETGELIVGTPDGIIKARDFKRHSSIEERWNIEQFNAFRGVPWATIPGMESDDIKSRVELPEPKGPIIPPEVPQSKPIQPPRRIMLRQDDVIKAGFTKGCS